ncbi:MAG: dTDP-4-amino-4,6-dideoxygalactose transaminase [bacterium]|jgi:dTDP-4-amino-4,6-dideoxygalactose transaminase
MLKVILTANIFVDALKKHDKTALAVLERSQNDEQVQVWILANVVETLIAEGVARSIIQKSLEGISRIPVNAKLTDAALNYPEGFTTGLYIAAAEVFKCEKIVGLEALTGAQSSYSISPQEFLSLEENLDEKNIDFLDLKAPLHSIYEQVDGDYMDIIQNTAFAGGNHVKEFEKEFAEYCQVKHAIGVSNGTEALLLALKALGVGPGDEVITVPNTFIATTEAISHAGANPVFVDVLPDTYNINPALIEEKITDKTKAIIPVHLYGQPVDIDPILEIAEKHNLFVLEDAAQAHGSEYKGRRAGSLGHIAAFSMYPGKNLGAFGEAGAIVTNDDKLAETISCLRDHGQSQKYYHRLEGFNGRMDNLQGAVLRAKLPMMDSWNKKRRKNAELYAKYLSDIKEITIPFVPENTSPVFHLYVVLVTEPKALHDFLKTEGIFTGFHYPIPLHLQEAYVAREEKRGDFPVTEQCADSLLSLPMFPELSEAQIKRVANTIKKFFAQ